MNHCPAAKIRRARFSLLAAALLFLLSPGAFAVPGDEADPPLPPTNFGNLFVFGPHVRDCKIRESDESSATIEFRSNFTFNQARYLDTAGVWSSWQSLSAHEYVCTAPNCLWFGGEVEIRGCTDSAGTNCPGACTVNAGPGVGGRPSVDPVGLPVPIVHHAGCAQTDHKEVSFQAQWTGTAANGYPRVKDADGNAVALTQVTGARANRVYTGTYTIPAGWESGFDGTWPFEFQLDAERVRKVNVKVSEHCLNAPQVFELDTAGTRTRVSDGAGVSVDVNSQMVVETGNSGLALTDHVLDPSTQTMGTVFRPTVPSAGTTLKSGWSEAGTAWDGRKYTSPQTNVNMTAGRNACVEDGSHRFWLDPAAPSFTLPESTAATPVATVRTDACEGAVGSKPTITPNNWHSLFGTIQVHWNILDGSEAAGWEVLVTPALAYGMILDGAILSGTGWPSAGAEISVDRAGATSCPAGERLVVGVCEPCPTYHTCAGNALSANQWCEEGSPPASDFMDSYQVCQAGTTQVVNQCFAADAPVPADAPCPGTCPPTPARPSCAMGESWVWLDATQSPPCGTWDRQLVPYPIFGACETATWDSASCSYTAVNRAGPEPAPGVCETVSLDTLLCNWEVTYTGGTPPPVGACETASLDPNTCTWSVVDTADAEPSVGACYSTSFDTNTCTWSVVDNTPSPPGYACGDVFDAASCTYSEAAAPAAPGYACGDVFNAASCSWSAAAAPSAPTTTTCESASFDSASCSWTVTANPCPGAPSGDACGSYSSSGSDSCGCPTYSYVSNGCPAAPAGDSCGSYVSDGSDSCGCPTYSYQANACPAAPANDSCGSWSSSGTDSCGCSTYSYQANACPAAPAGDSCGSYVSDGSDSCGCPTYSYQANACPGAPAGDSCGSWSADGTDSCGCSTYSYVSNGCPDAPTVGACESLGTSGNDSCGCPIYTVEDITEDPPPCDGTLEPAGCGWNCIIQQCPASPPPSGCGESQTNHILSPENGWDCYITTTTTCSWNAESCYWDIGADVFSSGSCPSGTPD